MFGRSQRGAGVLTMADFPALPLWTDAYLADTRHLTTLQHGAYLLLLMEAWRRPSCTLPDDDALLARLSGLTPQEWRASRDVVLAFWDRDGRRHEWKQKRLIRERDYVSQKRASQKGRIAKRWEATKKGPTQAIPDGYRSDTPTPTPTPTIETPNGVFPETGVSGGKARKRNAYSAEFESAWAAYPTSTNMSKAEAFKAWGKLDAADREAVAKAIPGFVAFCKKSPDYAPVYFDKFIRQRRFDGYAEAAAPTAVSEAQWRRRLIYARNKGVWSIGEWGPTPGAPGCQVPGALLEAGDGMGWRDEDVRGAA